MKLRSNKNFYVRVLLLFSCMIATCCFVATMENSKSVYASSQTYDFAQMSEEDCVDFIVENGVTIPDGWINENGFGHYVQSIIQAVDDDPNYFFEYTSYSVTLEFIQNIKDLVNSCKNLDMQQKSVSAMAAYSLQDNWVKDENGNWVSSGGYWGSDSLWDYNCYAYAIEMTDRPPQYTTAKQYQPGDFAGFGSFNENIGIFELATIVRHDLEFLGYSVSVESTAPTSLVAGNKLISIRRTTSGSSWEQDYHFMRYEISDGYWYHKPGFTAILKYKYHTGAKEWIRETSFCGVESAGGVPYDSEVYYIVFSNTSFTVNTSGNTITGIKQGANLSGSIEIPSIICGVPITAIDSSAFANQTGITSITLPNTITSIGANAFENCTNLTSISGFNNIVSIGAQAFKGCSSLTNISIPAGTTSIGAGAFAGCSNLNISVSSSNPNYSAEGNILYDKAKTAIVSAGNVSPTVIIPDTVASISPYAFKDNSKITAVHIYGSPSIGINAFADCANLNSVYIYSYTVPQIGSNAFTGDSFTLYVPFSRQSVYNTVFASYTTDITSIAVEISFVSDGAEIDTLNTYFGANIASLIDPFKAGYDFSGWYDNTSYTGAIYANGGLWDTTEDMTVYAKWTPKTYYIYFNGYGSSGLADKEVTYNEPIGALPTVSREGYTFYGWKNEYNEYFTENMVWQKLNSQSVTSDLRENPYLITYNGNGGTPSLISQTVLYNSVVNSLASATRENYSFIGWNTAADGSGQTITVPFTYTMSNDITLYAQYTNEYFVTFNKQNGTGGTDGVNAIFSENMPTGSDITAPTRTGYTFQGYYLQQNGMGTKYYNGDMSSAHSWDIASPTTIYAYWTGNPYTVTLTQCPPGFNESLTSTSSRDIVYIEFIPVTNGTITLWTSHTTGDPYLILYDSNLVTLAYNDDGYGNLDSKITFNVVGGARYFVGFRALSTTTTGKVYFSGVEVSPSAESIDVIYGSSMPTLAISAPSRAGYAFKGYFQEPNGMGTKYYNADLTSANNWNIAANTTIYADWEPNVYPVTLDKQGGDGIAENISATYLLPMPSATAPTRAGYTFQGYYTEPNGAGIKYYNADMTSARIWDIPENRTLCAYWKGNQYTVTLNNPWAPAFYTELTSSSSSDIIYLGFIPNSSGTITLWTSHTIGDPYLILYGSNFEFLTENDDGYGSLDAKITYSVVSGNKYYVGFRALSSTTNGQVKHSGVSITRFNAFSEVAVTYGDSMPTAGIKAQTKAGYTFKGYYEYENGGGVKYYDGPNLASLKEWDKASDATLYAHCEKTQYTLTFVLWDGEQYDVPLFNGDTIETDWAPYRSHYEFEGFYSIDGTKYIGATVGRWGEFYHMEPVNLGLIWNQNANLTLYAKWIPLVTNYSYQVVVSGEGYLPNRTIYIESGKGTTLNAPAIDGYTFRDWSVNGYTRANGSVETLELHRSYITGEITIYHYWGGSATYSDGYLYATYTKDPTCVAAGTLITLADGRQVPVESLTGNEMLRVWNLFTGSIDIAPILFIDHDAAMNYKVINLYFSDGTTVKVIYEHAFWDYDLNKYVFLREDAAQYIGHKFNKQVTLPNGKIKSRKVKLVNVAITTEYTTAWSPVTYGHLCYYVNGMLSMPGGTEGLINIFEVDQNKMKINQRAFEADIATYGLFTYEEFAELYPIPEEIFEAFGGQYLKVAIGKDLIDYETLGMLIGRYADFF